MIEALVAPPALHAMRGRLTLPFERGADARDLDLLPDGAPDHATVAAYGFGEYIALYGREPVPSYVLRARTMIAEDATVTVTGTDPAIGVFTIPVVVAGMGDGDSVVVPLPAGAGIQTRITALADSAVPTGAQAADRWSLTLLLGTTARLLWVIGAERDRLARLAREVHEQRTVARTGSAALDLVGADLAVPRFPPTSYSVDDDTVALYHFEDAPGALPAIADAAALFPARPPHHGAFGPTPPTPTQGRWGRGLRFGPASEVNVPAHTAFNIPMSRGFTVDLFVRPDVGSALGTVVHRGAGSDRWSIEIGDLLLGGRNAVRATVADGTDTLVASAAVDLPLERFSHVAAVLERDGTTARLAVVVDGRERAASTGPLSAVTGGGAIRLGPGPTAFLGTLDEVRISAVARRHFHPALSESDDAYRERLALFRRWELPTPSALQSVLNRLVPELNGVAAPFVVADEDSPIRGGGMVVRVRPRTLAPMESIDGDGRLRVSETELWPPIDGAAPAVLLGTFTGSGIGFAPVVADPERAPGLPAPDPKRMRPAVAAALTRLAALSAAAGLTGIRVVTGWDAAATDSRADGRGIVLEAATGSPGRLAALAHRAGFDLVEHRARGLVYAAVAPGRGLLVGPTGAGEMLQAGGVPRVEVGTPVVLEASLSAPGLIGAILPADAEVRFAPIAPPPGTVIDQAPGAHSATVTAVRPGALTLAVDISLGGRTTTVTVTLQAVPLPLADGESIAADGTMGVTETIVGAHPDFDPAYLGTINDPRPVLGAAPEDSRADRGVIVPLIALLDDLDAAGHGGALEVVTAYQPAAPPGDLAGEGRLLVLQHTVLDSAHLAVAAHAAGYAYVARSGTTVIVAAPPGEPVGVTGPNDIEVDEVVTLTVDPDPTAVSPTTRLGWSSAQVLPTAPDGQGVQLMSTTAPTVAVTGRWPGVAWVRATLREAGAQGPYALEVRLRPELAGAHLSLDQYYLVMNALHRLHPIGVEVLTEQLRAAVVELTTAPDGIDPSFTYPTFRVHRPVRSLRKESTDG